MTPAASTDGPVSRDDLEGKFRELRGEVDQAATSAKVPLMAAGAVVVIVAVAGAFLFGRRRGRKTTTMVEIKRV